MRKLALSLLVLCFALSPALAQRPQEQFPTYVLGKPTAAPPGPADRLPLIQGGVTRQLPAIATTSQPGLSYPDGTTLAINSAGKLTVIGGGGGGSGANPSATASDTVVNGAALTFMRSDAAPAVQKATNSVFGLAKGDGSTITCAAGVCSSLTGGAGTVTNSSNLTDHAPIIGNGGTVGIKSIAALTNGQVMCGATGADPTACTLSGDGIMAAGGALTITKTSGVNFSALATTVPGTGVATALGVNVGSAGAFVVNGGAGGTPSSITLTNGVSLPAATGLSGNVSVGNGGTGTGSMTANAIVKGNGSSAYSASTVSDDGTKISLTEPLDLTSKPVEIEVANAASTGTTLNKLAKLTGAPATAVVGAITDIDGMIGVVNGGAGTAGSARIAVSGTVNCVFDGATTAGDLVGISPTIAGACRDVGTSRPSGAQSVGRVLNTNGSPGTYAMLLDQNFTSSGSAGVGVDNGTGAVSLTAPCVLGTGGACSNHNIRLVKIASGWASGTVTLDAIAAVAADSAVCIADGGQNVDLTHTLTIAPNASDSIGGGTSGASIGPFSVAGNSWCFRVSGPHNWTQQGGSAVPTSTAGAAQFAKGLDVNGLTYGTLIAGAGISVTGTGTITVAAAGGVSKDVAGHTVTAAEWANWQVFDFTTAQTLTLPVATSLSANGGILIKTEGANNVTLAPNAADGINGGTINTSVTIQPNITAAVTTSGASGTGAFTVPLGYTASTNVTFTPTTAGTAVSSTGGGGFAPTWTSSTNPTLTCLGGGTLATTGNVDTIIAGKLTHIVIDLLLPASLAGCTGAVVIPLPNTINGNKVAFVGRESAVTGTPISFFNDGATTTLQCAQLGQTAPITFIGNCSVANWRLTATGIYGNS